MRVLHLRNVTGHHGIYGAEQCILAWMDEMRRQGQIEFVVGCFVGRGGEESEFVRAVRDRGITVEVIRMRHHQSPRVVQRLAALIRDERIDLVHTHENRSHILGLLSARRAGVPAVASIHGFTRETWKSAGYNLLNLLFLRFAPHGRLICVSEAMRRRLIRGWRFPLATTVTVHNGIGRPRSAQEELRGDIRRELGIGRRQPVIAVIGRLSREKGQRLLLEAAPMVLAEQAQAVFLLVGDGPDRKMLEARVAEHGLGRAVRFLGYRRDAPEILRTIDLLAIPSLSEGISMVLLEAMSRAVPVVATRVGGIPEVVVHGETGLMVPPGDARCLARGLCALLDRPERAREMGEEAEKRARETFPLSLAAERIRRIYEEVVGRSGAVPSTPDASAAA